MSDIREDSQEFINESQEYLDQIEPVLIGWLSDFKPENASTESIALVFRVFHSIKGVAGFLGFLVIQKLTHRIEELLDGIRSGKRALTESNVHLFINGCRHLRELIELIKKEDDDTTYASISEDFIAEINSVIDQKKENDQGVYREDHTFFNCFNSSEFIGRFESECKSEIEEYESILFGALDQPAASIDILTMAIDKLYFIEFNLERVNFGVGVTLIQPSNELLNFYKKKKKIEANDLSLLFKLSSFLKLNFNKRELDTVLQEELDANNLHIKQLKDVEKAKEQVIVIPKVENKKVLSDSNQVSESTTTHNEIKIDTQKIDELVELIEDLGVISGVISKEANVKDFDEYAYMQAKGKLQQITSDLQDVAMSIRLVPLTSVFRKMSRLVYDVSNKLSKKVNLNTIGENTPIDKTTLDSLQDPLVHIFRNAIDHGIELPAERILKGKKAEGTITLSANIEGGEFVLIISDDGKGIDREFILKKAISKGIVSESDNLTDGEINNLIMAAGFSTAETVTDFSGRGVGMDVVKQSIESLNGKIEIESTLGIGSKFIISIPLTSTLVEMVLVRVGDVHYSIRISSVKEFFQSDKSSIIKTPDGLDNIRIRDSVYPLYNLANLKVYGKTMVLSELPTFLLVENKGQLIVLVADEIVGINHNVVKPLPNYFKKVKGVSGCSVIGNQSNSICWNVDINDIMLEMNRSGK